jgi:ABC-type arginine transport system permease subunit
MALNGLIIEKVWAGEQDLEKLTNLVGLESFFFLLAIAFLYFFLTTISRLYLLFY